MATILARPTQPPPGTIVLALDRWIWVIQAAVFILIVLTGFVPSSVEKVGEMMAGQRPSFPPILHVHALLMGTFLLFLFGQATLMATGRRDVHMSLGRAVFLLVPAMVIAGFILIPVNYAMWWDFAQAAAPEAREALQRQMLGRDNTILLAIRSGILFPIFIAIGLWARRHDSGLHKRMMLLATAIPMPGAFNRMDWIPTTMPDSPLAPTLYICLSVAPLFLWDVIRNHRIHRAWWIWLALFLPVTAAVHGLWETAWWHATVPWLMGVN